MQTKQQDNQNKPRKFKKPNKSFYQYMKKDQSYQSKTFIVPIALENHSQIAQIIQKSNHLITLTTEVDHQIKEVHEIPHKIDIIDHRVEKPIIQINIQDQTQTDRIIALIPVPIHILGMETIQMIDQETHHTIDTEIIPTKGTEVIQIIAINNITIDHEIIQTIDQITKVLIITIINIDYEKIHNTGIQTITINKKTTLNHLIGITHVIQTLKTNIEVINQNIRDNEIKYKQLMKQIQTTWY